MMEAPPFWFPAHSSANTEVTAHQTAIHDLGILMNVIDGGHDLTVEWSGLMVPGAYRDIREYLSIAGEKAIYRFPAQQRL
jgi:hypothetical protein